MEYISKKVQNKRLFLLDIDGTIALDNTLIDGTMDFINQVNRIKGKYIFITNNSTKSISDYIVKFTKLGIRVDETNFLTASSVTASYLKEHYTKELLFVVGTKSFIKELKSYGLFITEEEKEDIKAAIVGFDDELTYQKIYSICHLLQTRDIDYIATNPDLVCPTAFGFIPDCGAICDFIEKAVKRIPTFIGKPNRLMVDLAIAQTGYTKEETLVVGDRLYTDIACGIQGEVETLVVFTGEARKEDLENTKFPPTYYCETIKQLYNNIC